ncbi:MAG: RpoL/Rpb11 RNA polymerase subunit family protein [Candidatus Aenigmatarchaeota archaeon]
MEIVKLKEDKNSVLLELRGESFTLASLLEEELWENKRVVEAAAFREHPYLSEVKLWIKIDKGDIKDVLSETADNILRKIKDLKETFEKT